MRSFSIALLVTLACPALAADPAPTMIEGKQRYRLLVMDLKPNDVDASTVQTLQGFITTGLSQYSELDVVSGDDVKQLVALHAERATMGCSDDASCLAEVADALGAQLVVFGNAGKLDDELVLNINLFDSTKAMGLGRVVVQGNVKSLPKKLGPKLHDLLGRFYKERGLTLPPYVEEPEPAPPVVVAAAPVDPGPWPWVTAATGAVLLVGGATAASTGYLFLAQFQDSKQQVTALERQFAEDGDVAHVEAARAEQVTMLEARDNWNNFGVFMFDAGIPLAAVGLLAGTGGLIWALSTPPPAEPAPAAPTTPAAAPAAAGGAR